MLPVQQVDLIRHPSDCKSRHCHKATTLSEPTGIHMRMLRLNSSIRGAKLILQRLCLHVRASENRQRTRFASAWAEEGTQ